MNFQYSCRYFQQPGSATAGRDRAQRAYEQWLNHLRAIAAYLVQPRRCFEWEKTDRGALRSMLSAKPRRYHEGLADERDYLSCSYLRRTDGKGYLFELPLEIAKPASDGRPPQTFHCGHFDRPIDWFARADGSGLTCPCVEVGKLSEQDGQTFARESRELTAIGALHAIFTWAYELRWFVRGESGYDDERHDISPLIFAPGMDYQIHIGMGADPQQPEYLPLLRIVDALRDRYTADFYRDWYRRERHYHHLNGFSLGHYHHPPLLAQLFDQSLENFNFARDESLVFAEIGATWQTPLRQLDALEAMEKILVPAVDVAKSPYLSASRSLSLGKSAFSWLNARAVRKNGIAYRYLDFADEEAILTEVNHHGYMNRDAGGIAMTNKGNLLLVGGRKISVFSMQRLLIEVDSPRSWIIKVVGDVNRLRVISRYPLTWRAIFEGVNAVEKTGDDYQRREITRFSLGDLHPESAKAKLTALFRDAVEGGDFALLQDFMEQQRQRQTN